MGNLIVKDNALIEASHKLSESEQRLILLAIIKGREFCDNIEHLRGKELEIHADDYMQAFGVERHAAYESLKKAVMGLYRAEWGYKYINDKGKTVVRYERFTQSAEYVENGAEVKFRFADAIIPMLVELERNFTSYEIEQVANLQSRYAMRLYEFLIRFKTSKKLEISLEDLRFRFGLLEHEYQLMSDFKKRVLDLAVKQINDNTDITVKYEQHKKGRNVIGFTFIFRYKPQAEKSTKQQERDPNTIDWVNGTTDNESKLLTQKQADYFASKLANDSGFGGKFGGSGESMQAFVNRISSELQRDISKVAVYMPYLLAQGYGKTN
jgi:plasmid replication initiation protein